MAALLLLAIYAAASLILFIFGLNCYVLLALFFRRRRSAAAFNARVIETARLGEPAEWPLVTTQIPIYNEANVAERILRATAMIDYPRDRHQIQVLDDSTDITRAIVERVVAELHAAGHWITVLHRPDRTGFKAGALQAGLQAATGELVAIFDADFVPPPEFLRQTVPFLQLDPGLGLVQGRWGHINPDESLLTRTQAIGIDGHFMIEQSARAFNGLMMNFNGTAGVWRRQAIEGAGGWSADTLTEDLDLSYRAQLAGWRTHFVAEAVVPAELPADITAFKSQQFRWAKGSIQTALKILPAVWRAPLKTWVKVQATLHLTHYLIHPLMLLVAVLALPVLWLFPVDLPGPLLVTLTVMLLIALAAPGSLYLTSQHLLNRAWHRQLIWMPAMMCLGVGLAVSNSRAVWEALLGRSSAFVRTPKQGSVPSVGYRAANTVLPWVELAVGLYCTVTIAANIGSGRYLISPYLFIYAVGFATMAVSGLRSDFRSRRDMSNGDAATALAA